MTYPGCVNGYCLAPWQCICQHNWGGVLCDQELDYCATHEPCKNNGTCQSTEPGKYKCSCGSGFSGPDCDLSSEPTPDLSLAKLSAGCSINPCLHGGICFGFESLLSDTPADLAKATSSNQTEERIYRCQCQAGWVGDYCQWPDTATPLVDNSTEHSLKTQGAQAFSSRTNNSDQEPDSTTDGATQKAQPFILSGTNEPQSVTLRHSQIDWRHLVSGVFVASIVGVFIATVLVAWCCFMVAKSNRFSFILFSVIRDGNAQETIDGVPISRLRRVQERIRNSIRSSRIGTGSKLSLENVLRPPPSYEESKLSKFDKFRPSSLCINNHDDMHDKTVQPIEKAQHTSLVIRGALGEKLASAAIHPPSPDYAQHSKTYDVDPNRLPISESQLTCPRHGHLYRQQMLGEGQMQHTSDRWKELGIEHDWQAPFHDRRC